MAILAVSVPSRGKYLFRCPARVVMRLFFLLLRCISSLRTLDGQSPLGRCGFAGIFSHSLGCLFVLLRVSFGQEEEDVVKMDFVIP